MAQMQTNAQKPKSSDNWFQDTALWKLKVRLQFSGWLQYLVHAIVVLAMLLLAGLGWLIGYWPVLLVWLPLGIAAVLFVPLIGSIFIVKYGLHPTESLPANKTSLGAFDLMRARRSCRSFQSRNLTSEHHAKLMEAVGANSEPGRKLGQRPAQDHPNHSERYATHQLKTTIGMVTAMLHINGSVKSAINPSAMNSPQNIFRSMQRTSLLPARCFAAGSADVRAHPER